MPTARELLQEIDALMRRNRAAADGGAEGGSGRTSGGSAGQGAEAPPAASVPSQDNVGSIEAGPPTEVLADRPADGSPVPGVPDEHPRPVAGQPSRADAPGDEARPAGDFDGIPVLTDRAPAAPAEVDDAIPTLSAVMSDDLPVLTEALDPDLAARWAAAQALAEDAADASIPADSGVARVEDVPSRPAIGEGAAGIDAGPAAAPSEPDAMLAEAAAQVPLASGIAAIDPTALDGFIDAYEPTASPPAAHETPAAAGTAAGVAREDKAAEPHLEDEIAVEAALAAGAHAAAMSFDPRRLEGDFAVGSRGDEPLPAAEGEVSLYSQADAEAEIEALIAAEALAAASPAAQAARILPPLPPRAVVQPEPALTATLPLPTATADDARWSAMAEEIRIQVLQRVDLFTESGLTAQLAQKLQPIVADASAQLVATINREVGALLRAYIAETIEREIEQWRHKGEP